MQLNAKKRAKNWTLGSIFLKVLLEELWSNQCGASCCSCLII